MPLIKKEYQKKQIIPIIYPLTLYSGCPLTMSFMNLRKQERLDQRFPHVSVLWPAFLPSGLLSTVPLNIINRFNIGFCWGFEHAPTENTGILPTGDTITVNRVQLPTTGIIALQIDWARHTAIITH